MPAVDVLARSGIVDAQLVVETAAAVGLELAAACAMLEKETAGGQNVWGHDGGAIIKGGPVTQANYASYRHAIETGRSGRQGCGPTQLTYGPLQNQADDLGGCWVPRHNLRVGFQNLAGLIRSHGLTDGFRRYNGSGPAATAYANDAMVKLGVWRARLGGAGSAPAAPSTSGAVLLKQGDTGPAVLKLQAWLNAHYPAYSKLDLGPQRFGPQTAGVVKEFQKRSGLTADGVIGPITWGALIAAGYRP